MRQTTHVGIAKHGMRGCVGTGPCSCRVRRVDGSCAEHLTVFNGHYLPTVILIIIGIPSPTHSFIPVVKPSFSTNPSHRSFFFSFSGFTTWILQTVYFYF